jgi:hypothetical protein
MIIVSEPLIVSTSPPRSEGPTPEHPVAAASNAARLWRLTAWRGVAAPSSEACRQARPGCVAHALVDAAGGARGTGSVLRAMRTPWGSHRMCQDAWLVARAHPRKPDATRFAERMGFAQRSTSARPAIGSRLVRCAPEPQTSSAARGTACGRRRADTGADGESNVDDSSQ